MAVVEFRCEKCGKLLKADAEPGERLRCPHCGRKLTVPAALASLPHPQVPPAARPEGQEPEPSASGAGPSAVVALAGAMPWVLSVLLHLGLFLIMVFLMVVIPKTQAKPPPLIGILPPQPAPGEKLGGFRSRLTDRASRGRNDRRTVVQRRTRRDGRIDPGVTEKTIDIIGIGKEGSREGADAELGLRDQDIRGRGFYDEGDPVPGGAYNIVYVIDRSGSMSMTFDEVKGEMIRSISRLKGFHDFHIILFSDNRVIEGPRRRLVPADLKHKLAAWRFLRPQGASGHTTALVALKRAFAVLSRTRRPGKLIYLLSDGHFAGLTGGSTHRAPDGRLLQGNEAVVQWLRDHNATGDVYINTLLLHSKDQTAIRVLRTIAHKNGGRFKHISRDE